MKINKKFLQCVAAALILIFHLGISVSDVDNFIIKIGYIGVDIFLFTSAYSLADKDIDYKSFLKNRFTSIYLKFLVFVLIAAIYKGMKVLSVIKILTLVEFFEKGGGAFLWYVPAIALFYLVYPFFIKWDNKYKSLAVLVGWFIVSYIFDKMLGYNKVFIFTNRIPIILIGYSLKKYKIPNWLALVCFPIGVFITYFFGYMNKLHIPFTDFYFASGVVLTVGICAISTYVKENKFFDTLSRATLDLYCIQMIFGVKYVTLLYRLIGDKIITNLVMIASMFIIALISSKIFSELFLIVKNIAQKTQ